MQTVSTNSSPHTNLDPAAGGTFLAIKPVVERHANVVFRHLRPVDLEEAVAEAVAAAFVNFLRLTLRGQNPMQFSSVMATRAAQHVKQGRLTGNKMNSSDVLSLSARLRRGFRLQFESGDGENWAEAFTDDAHTPIPDQVSFRCDFPRWLATLTERDRRIACYLALGNSTNWVASRLGISAGRISQVRRKLQRSWYRFHGDGNV